MKLVLGYDKFIAGWVASRIGLGLGQFGDCVGIGVTDGHRTFAGFVFHDYRGNQMEISAAADSPRWATRGIIADIFRYPFEQAKVGRLQTIQAVDNERARRLVEGLGFKFEGVARRAYHDGRDANVFSMLPEECNWLNYGQKITLAATAA